MKKKFVTVISAAAVAGMLAGCSGELSNEYVTVTQYKGLEVPQASGSVEEVTDEQVDQMIEGTLSAYAEREEVSDRAAQEGDIVNIDYTGYLDGEAFDGGSAEGADLELGSRSFIGATDDYAGFEEQIEGHNPGDEFDIQVQFPDPVLKSRSRAITRETSLTSRSSSRIPIPGIRICQGQWRISTSC